MAEVSGGERIVSWAEVHRDAKMLVRRLLPASKWTGIVAISRGGLVPAAIVAREMDIRVLDTISIVTYDTHNEKMRGDARVLKEPERAVADQGKGWLVIDDLVDTGVTMRKVREILPHAYVATVYAKPEGTPLVDTYVHDVPQNVWIYFPWDTDVTYSAPLGRG